MELTSQQLSSIDNFLTGDMAAVEKQQFENELAANPTLREELNFQQSIVNGIQEYRKIQLKSRLQAIDVTPGVFESLVSSTAVKVVSGVIISAGIGFGIYLNIYNSEVIVTPLEENTNVLKSSEETIIEPSNNADLKDINDTEKVAEKIKSNTNKISVAEEKPSNTLKENFTPVIDLPEIDVLEEIDEFEAEDISDIGIMLESPPLKNSAVLDMSVQASEDGKLRYIYYNETLTLFGDFSKSPYEVLEIRSDKETELYLYYDLNYYSLINSSEKQLLEPILDISKIEQLKELKNQ